MKSVMSGPAAAAQAGGICHSVLFLCSPADRCGTTAASSEINWFSSRGPLFLVVWIWSGRVYTVLRCYRPIMRVFDHVTKSIRVTMWLLVSMWPRGSTLVLCQGLGHVSSHPPATGLLQLCPLCRWGNYESKHSAHRPPPPAWIFSSAADD